MAKKRSSMRERVKERAQESSQKGVGYLKIPEGVSIDFFKPKKGNYTLNIIPYEVTDKKHPDGSDLVGQLWYRRPIKVHYSIGADEKKYLCPRTIGKKCPICEASSELYSNGDVDDAKEIKAKDRELYLVQDVNEDDKGLQLWDTSYHLFGKQLEEEIREGQDEWAAFPDPDEGYEILVRFAEKTLGKNTFVTTNRIDFNKRDYTIDDELLDEAPQLDDMLNIKTYDELKAIFYEEDDVPAQETTTEEEDDVPDNVKPSEKVEEVEEARKPKRNRRKKTTKQKCEYGYKFGIDCGEYDECLSDCEQYDECLEASEAE